MPTPPRRSRDLSGLLTRTSTPTPLTPEQERVAGWISLWLDGRMTEAEITRRLNADFWHVDDMTWTDFKAHGGWVRNVLVQAREADREWQETTPSCGPTPMWGQVECDAASRCGQHRRHGNLWADIAVTFYGELVWAVPTRARASVEASRAAVEGRDVPERKGGKK